MHFRPFVVYGSSTMLSLSFRQMKPVSRCLLSSIHPKENKDLDDDTSCTATAIPKHLLGLQETFRFSINHFSFSHNAVDFILSLRTTSCSSRLLEFILKNDPYPVACFVHFCVFTVFPIDLSVELFSTSEFIVPIVVQELMYTK